MFPLLAKTTYYGEYRSLDKGDIVRDELLQTYIGDVNKEEIKNQNSFQSLPSPEKWYRTDQQYNQAKTTYKHQLAHNKQNYNKYELKSIFHKYEQNQQLKNKVLEKKRWKRLFQFISLILDTPEYRNISLNYLYESFFRQQPNKYISFPQFLIVLRNVFGFNIASDTTTHLVNEEMVIIINKLFESFDDKNIKKIDWRSFIFMLSIVYRPLIFARKQYEFGFMLYASDGCIETSEDHLATSLQNMIELFLICCPEILKQHLKELIEEAWVSLVSNDEYASDLVRDSERKGKQQKDIQINFACFKKLFYQPSIRLMFIKYEKMRFYDNKPLIYEYETLYYHSTLVKFLRERRKEARNEVLCEEFRSVRPLRVKRLYFQSWVHRNKIRRYALNGIQKYIHRYFMERVSKAFLHWDRLVLEDLYAIDIQRIYRGHYIRKRYRLLTFMNDNILKIQAWYRSIKGKSFFQSFLVARKRAAINLQRRVRGNIGRRVAYHRFLNYLDEEYKNLRENKDVWKDKREYRAAAKIQRWTRDWIRRRREYEELLQKLRKQRIQNEEDEARRIYEREKAEYRKQLISWYEAEKIDYFQTLILEDHTLEEKRKLFRYKRRFQEAEKEKEKLLVQEEKQKELQRLKTEHDQKWIAIATKEAQRRHGYLVHCLNLPDNKEEKQTRKTIRKRIKTRATEILREADEQGYEIEYPEALVQARKDVLEVERQAAMDEVHAKGEEEWKRWIEEEEERKEKERLIMLKRWEREKMFFAERIQGAWRRYLAYRKMRNKCYELYEKHFDAEHNAYYYLNMITQEVIWKKPRGLGSYDIRAVEGWVTLYDDYGDVYYYHANARIAQYTNPEDSLSQEQDLSGPTVNEVLQLTGLDHMEKSAIKLLKEKSEDEINSDTEETKEIITKEEEKEIIHEDQEHEQKQNTQSTPDAIIEVQLAANETTSIKDDID